MLYFSKITQWPIFCLGCLVHKDHFQLLQWIKKVLFPPTVPVPNKHSQLFLLRKCFSRAVKVELFPMSLPAETHYLESERGRDHGQVVQVISHFSCALWVKTPLCITSLWWNSTSVQSVQLSPHLKWARVDGWKIRSRGFYSPLCWSSGSSDWQPDVYSFVFSLHPLLFSFSAEVQMDSWEMAPPIIKSQALLLIKAALGFYLPLSPCILPSLI